MHGALGFFEMVTVLPGVIMLFGLKRLREFAAEFQKELERLHLHLGGPQLDLRGIEWLALALLVLFLELIWVAGLR